MQKKLIALAVAGLVSAPAFAQSNVTVYGIVDAAVGVGSHGDNDFRGVVDGVLSGNRFGLKGSEDLGNGLKAVFTLEQGFDIGNGEPASTKQFHRQAWVGLQGSFGTVGLGRQYAPGYFAGYDAALSGIVSPQSILSSGAGMTITPNSPARWDNSVAYTGTFGALTARAIYSANATETTKQATLTTPEVEPSDDDKWGVSLDYANGPLKAGVVYQYLKQSTDDQKEWYVGGEYNFGVLTLAGSYQRMLDGDVGLKTAWMSTALNADYTAACGAAVSGTITCGDVDAKLWQVGVIVPTSAAGKVHVAYGSQKVDNDEDFGAKSWVLAYTHALSKRTTGYAAYNRTSNGDFVGQFGNVSGNEEGKNSSLFAVGMRHAF